MPDVSRIHALILGSERGVRRLDPTQSYPLSLSGVVGDGQPPSGAGGDEPSGQSVLEWTLAALEQSGVRERWFVGGYHIQKVVERFPTLRFAFHAGWEREGPLAALTLGLRQVPAGADVLVMMGEVVIRPTAIEALRSGGIGSRGSTDTGDELVKFGFVRQSDPAQKGWSLRAGRATPGGELGLSGVVLIPAARRAEVMHLAERLMAERPLADLEALARAMAAGMGLGGVDITLGCASVRQPRDLASFVLGTKAQTLERLAPLITEAIIPPVKSFTVSRWRADPEGVLAEIRRDLHAGSLVVRSSSLLEDLFESSSAGRFHSELDVSPADLPASIERVIASYARGTGAAGGTEGAGARSADEAGRDQVLVQPYVAGAVFNGVLFTRLPDDGAPYAVLNYERAEGRTDTITGGRAAAARTAIRARHLPDPAGEDWIARAFRLGRRLEELLRHDGLDIELVVDAEDRLYLLQVRPVAVGGANGGGVRSRAYGDGDVRFELERVAEAVAEITGPSATLLGERGALGVMPDWNPAEIIGVCPRPLALSLYRHVVTDRVWAEARAAMGYRTVEFTPLLHALGGRPYIDVRASLNSLLPATLDDESGAMVIDAAIARLREQPQLHDKIEFELMPTCGDADPDRWRQQLGEQGLKPRRIERLLRACALQTGALLERGSAEIDQWLTETRALGAARLAAGGCAASASAGAHLRAAGMLLDATCARGTKPFASLARCAFIALSLLRSLERIGVLTRAELDAVLSGLPSVAGDVAGDLAALRGGQMGRAEFLARHGHLRPGTYDILSPSYAEGLDDYLGEASGGATSGAGEQRASDDAPAREVLKSRRGAIAAAIAAAGIDAGVDSLIEFICTAIPARELAKHEFTRNVSMALDHVARAGEKLGLSRDDLSYLHSTRLLQLGAETPSAAERTELQRIIALARKRHQLSMALRMPHLIFDPAAVSEFTVSALRPNFVTRERASGPGRFLRVGTTPTGEALAGAVVLIENADPGYDWVFSHRIAGLVTKYGGVASHMAIRAAEFAIPAAIGCGDTIFDPLTSARLIELDCAAERVRGAA